MAFLLRVSHLCMFNVLLSSVAVYDTESTPLCGRMNGSTSLNDNDHIYFPDQSNGIRRMEINGTIITCNPDGTIISAIPANESLNASITEDRLKERIEHKDDNQYLDGVVREAPLRSFVPNVSKCAENDQSFCTKDDNYPLDFIRKLLEKYSHKYAEVFGTDLSTNEVAFRTDVMDEEHLCESREQVIYPTSGKRKDGSEMYIVNTDDHQQGVRVSLCQTKGQPCKMSESFPNAFRTECKQQMVYRELLSISPKGEPVKDHFEFPACCSCVLHRIN